MSIFTNPFKKIGSGLSHLSTRIRAKNPFCKNTKAAGLFCTIPLAGKLGHVLLKKVGKKVNDAVTESKNNAVADVKSAVNRELEKFILDCILRWVLYLSMILVAYRTAMTFHLRKDVLVAFVILGIYSFYALKAIRACRWYLSFCRTNGLMFNPVHIMRAYLRNAILDRVQRTRQGLSLFARLAMNFFGPSSDQIASDITERTMQSPELRREAIARVAMWIGGWIIYALIYEKLFLLVTGIDFNAIWQPIIWPFQMVLTILSTQ